jgi:hypothetical protein
MPGLVPGIYVFRARAAMKTWMAGTSVQPGHDDNSASFVPV